MIKKVSETTDAEFENDPQLMLEVIENMTSAQKTELMAEKNMSLKEFERYVKNLRIKAQGIKII